MYPGTRFLLLKLLQLLLLGRLRVPDARTGRQTPNGTPTQKLPTRGRGYQWEILQVHLGGGEGMPWNAMEHESATTQHQCSNMLFILICLRACKLS